MLSLIKTTAGDTARMETIDTYDEYLAKLAAIVSRDTVSLQHIVMTVHNRCFSTEQYNSLPLPIISRQMAECIASLQEQETPPSLQQTIKASGVYEDYILSSLKTELLKNDPGLLEVVYAVLNRVSVMVYHSMLSALEAHVQCICTLSDKQFVQTLLWSNKIEEVSFADIKERYMQAFIVRYRIYYQSRLEQQIILAPLIRTIVSLDPILAIAINQLCYAGHARMGETIVHEYLRDVLTPVFECRKHYMESESRSVQQDTVDFENIKEICKLYATIASKASLLCILSSQKTATDVRGAFERVYALDCSVSCTEHRTTGRVTSVGLSDSVLLCSLKRGPLSFYVRALSLQCTNYTKLHAELFLGEMRIGDMRRIAERCSLMPLIDGSRIEILDEQRRQTYDSLMQHVILLQPQITLCDGQGNFDSVIREQLNYSSFVQLLVENRIPSTVIAAVSRTIYDLLMRFLLDDLDNGPVNPLEFPESMSQSLWNYKVRFATRHSNPGDLVVCSAKSKAAAEKLRMFVRSILLQYADRGKLPLKVTLQTSTSDMDSGLEMNMPATVHSDQQRADPIFHGQVILCNTKELIKACN